MDIPPGVSLKPTVIDVTPEKIAWFDEWERSATSSEKIDARFFPVEQDSLFCLNVHSVRIEAADITRSCGQVVFL
jgi:hypothetical protein